MLRIIYYAWINPKKNYKPIIEGQMDDLIASGISKFSKLYVVASIEDESLIKEITNIFNSKLKNNIEYEIEIYKENYYEYYGINKMYSLALENPNDYFLYFHSKGMMPMYDNSNEKINGRHIFELTLTNGTINKFKEALHLFETNDKIMKIGMFPSAIYRESFIWFNFYYARGSYLITCEKPIISLENRYYYETWSETGNTEMGLVYNLYENNYKKYELHEAGGILLQLNGSY